MEMSKTVNVVVFQNFLASSFALRNDTIFFFFFYPDDPQSKKKYKRKLRVQNNS